MFMCYSHPSPKIPPWLLPLGEGGAFPSIQKPQKSDAVQMHGVRDSPWKMKIILHIFLPKVCFDFAVIFVIFCIFLFQFCSNFWHSTLQMWVPKELESFLLFLRQCQLNWNSDCLQTSLVLHLTHCLSLQLDLCWTILALLCRRFY